MMNSSLSNQSYAEIYPEIIIDDVEQALNNLARLAHKESIYYVKKYKEQWNDSWYVKLGILSELESVEETREYMKSTPFIHSDFDNVPVDWDFRYDEDRERLNKLKDIMIEAKSQETKVHLSADDYDLIKEWK